MTTPEHPERPNYLRRRSWRLFWGSLVIAVCTFFILAAGLNALGAGHGSADIWELGLLMWFVSWLTLLGSCVTGFMSWRQAGPFPIWLVPGGILLLSTGLLGLWGLGG